MVTLQRRVEAQLGEGDERAFFADTLAEYQWARDAAGFAASTLDKIVKPVIEVCDFYGVVPWRLTPRMVDKYFAGVGKRAQSTVRAKLNHIDGCYAFLEQRYAGEIARRFAAAVESPRSGRAAVPLRADPVGGGRAEPDDAGSAVDAVGVPYGADAGRGPVPDGTGPASAPASAAARCGDAQLRTWDVVVGGATGQLALLRCWRLLLPDHAKRIRGRHIPADGGRVACREGTSVGRPAARRRRAAERHAAVRTTSPHQIAPNQLLLFDTPVRDWTGLDRTALPALTPEAQGLLTALDEYATQRGWETAITDFNRRTLRTLLSWLGAAAPIHEIDVKAVAALGANLGARRALQFLTTHNMLVPDPAGLIDPDQQAIEQQISTLPDQLAREVNAWVSVLRGQGRRPSPVMSWDGIHRYSRYVLPVVRQWSLQTDSLRSITTDDINGVLAGGTGGNANAVRTALRSLFRALKRERIIFRDPTRAVRGAARVVFPRPLPPDKLNGLLDQAPTALARLVAALVAIHALRAIDLRAIQLADLDRAAGRLLVHRRHGPRRVILDELTLQLTDAWLRERARRRPRTTNPHLLVSQQSAVDPAHPPVSRYVIHRIFTDLGVTPSQLRIDRILDEARHTADPVHLMRVFGISDGTAMRYLYTTHPERRSTLPK